LQRQRAKLDRLVDDALLHEETIVAEALAEFLGPRLDKVAQPFTTAV
jgi:hypothetical protein